jgi:spore germination protein
METLKRFVFLTLLSSIVMLTGCSPYVDNNTIEEIAPVIFWSINDAEDDLIRISTLVPPLVKEKKSLFTLKVHLLKEGSKKFNLIYYRELKSGQLRMLFINEKFARKGISPLLNIFLADPDISQHMYVVVVQGDFEQYIRNNLSTNPDLDYYLYRLFKHYESKNQGEMSIINLHQYMKKLYSPYEDPILPVFKVDKKGFSYEGTAFFRKNKMIATAKELDEQIMQLIDNDQYLKKLTLTQLSTVMGQVRSKTRMEFSPDHSQLTLKVEVSGRVEEYRGAQNLLDQSDMANLEKQIKSLLDNQTTKLIQNMQRWKIDPLEVGTHLLRPFSKPMSESEWLDQWARMKVKVDYQVRFHPLSNVFRTQ